ncbi:hypothetical protein [Glaciecola sp. MF2-115]|uniref:sulfotransferase-like domain-containing protein n=1 Tax=Glaciecola sp. MF2-115 TaxID=3384827 RepID=UPI0039A391FB
MTTRIAMWSGPRNISTAMMRSWENRPDCEVIDEPFYAYYLNATKEPHPMFDEVLASQPTSFAEVARNMSEGSCERPIQYQKHMTQHMLPNCDLTWAKDLRHCMLIRAPACVVLSYTNSRGKCSAEDTGIKRQFELYEAFSKLTGQDIPIIDSVSVLADPKSAIPAMCEALHVKCDEEITNAMLNWPQGRRDSDGIWAEHWYHSVEKSTGFAGSKPEGSELSPEQKAVVDEVMPFYEQMRAKALTF